MAFRSPRQKCRGLQLFRYYGAVNIRGERILVFGDSLTKHGADSSPEVWNVDAGSSRSSSAPGDLLASMLLERGAAAVRTNARVGRSAMNFYSRENAKQLLADDIAWRPTKVIVMLGTNDIGRSPDGTRTAMTAIRDTFKGAGAEVWAIGPPLFVSPSEGLNGGALQIIGVMKSVFGGRFVDARYPTEQAGALQNRARDGVHFTAASARPMAETLASTLSAKLSPTVWWTIGAVVGGASAAWLSWHLISARLRKRRTKTVQFSGPGGRCFPWAFENVKDGTFMHGKVRHPWTGQIYDHAWIEKDGRVLDWQSCEMGLGPGKDGWDRDDFYARWKPTNVKALTAAQLKKRPWLKHGPLSGGDKLRLEIADYEAVDALREAAKNGERFGGRKVFLSSIVDMKDPQTRRVLLALQRDGLIELTRADLVAAMDPKLVKASELDADGATYHFLVDDGDALEGPKTKTRKHSEELFIRFGEWHPTERSRNYARGGTEDGVSVYDVAWRSKEKRWDVRMPTEADNPHGPEDTFWTLLKKAEAGEDPVFILKGDVVGVGHDGEPLIRNIRVVKKVDPKDLVSSDLRWTGLKKPLGDIDINILRHENKWMRIGSMPKAAGYKQIPCKSGLDKRGDGIFRVRCWSK